VVQSLRDLAAKLEMKIKASRILLIITGFVLLVAALTAYLFHAKRKSAVDNYRAELVAKGEKLTISELVPPGVRAEQNSLATFQSANRLLAKYRFFDTNAPSPMRYVKPGKALVAWAQPDVRNEKTNTWNECQAAAAEEEELTQLLESIIERPVLHFHLDYGGGFSVLLPHLAPLKRCEQHLSITAICDLQRGDPESATLKIRAMLAIVKGMENERLIVSQLHRIAIANIAVAATWELIQSPKVTDEQLATLQREWTAAEFLYGAENALLMQRALCEDAAARMRQSSTEFREQATMYSRNSTPGPSGWFDQAANMAVLKTKESVWRFAWSDPDELKMLRGQQIILDSIRLARRGQPFESALRQQETGLAALGVRVQSSDPDRTLYGIDENVSSMMSQSLLSIQRFSYRIFRIEAVRQLVIGAIALKRYQLGHGIYPTRLSGLTPEFVAAVPHDPVDGKPLRYRLNSDGTFILYSVGEDEKDDGGDPSPATPSKSTTWLQGRDWVWPQSASEDELKLFYAKEAATRAGPGPLAEFEKRYGLNATNSPSLTTNRR
jgi:hypothetical protein